MSSLETHRVDPWGDVSPGEPLLCGGPRLLGGDGMHLSGVECFMSVFPGMYQSPGYGSHSGFLMVCPDIDPLVLEVMGYQGIPPGL